MNKLKNESSLYLQQHASNPVDWYPWGDEAFEKAQQENKLILVSIGYSSCHWCHVMEHESFEDVEVAGYMNQHFVSIKVDREEHPEVDAYFMYVLQAMTGQGGWPLHVFTTPTGEPLYGGTYFPPQPMSGRPSWMQVLQSMQRSWSSQDPQLTGSVENFQEFISSVGEQLDQDTTRPTQLDSAVILQQMKYQMDAREGGFSSAPKFPMLMTIEWMLELGLAADDEEAVELVRMNLRKILHGGIYDQVQGGLMRYSVDGVWLVPHFEKMLYTQAQLIPLLARCKKLWPEEDLWDYYLDRSIEFIDEWMGSPEQGYAAAIDADTPDGEGYYYTFAADEIAQVLDDEPSRAMFGVGEKGNYNSRYILHFGEEVTYSQVQPFLQEFGDIQKQRTPPAIDPKRITAWNAYLAVGLARTYIYTTDVMHLEQFRVLSDHLLSRYSEEAADVHVDRIVYDSGERVAGAGEDYALMALVFLYRHRFDQREEDLQSAERLVRHLETFFHQKKYYTNTSTQEKNIPQYKLDFMDDMIPDVNSVMLENYQILALLTQKREYIEKLDVLSTQLMGQMQGQAIYRAYAGRRLSLSEYLQKVETNLAWSDIRSPLPETMWLSKTPHDEEDIYLQVCDMKSCSSRLTDKSSCLGYFDSWELG